MTSLVTLRIILYTTVIFMHISNFFYMRSFARRNQTIDETAAVFRSLQFRFFTTWTYMLQTAYSIFGLVCDLILLLRNYNKKKNSYQLPKIINSLREVWFSGIVWPCTLVVTSVFWGLYAIDRDLIFPKFLDSIVPTISNHIIHTMIIPVVLFEVLLRPRFEPESHAMNITQLVLYLCLYLSVLLFTYFEREVWLYPIFKKVYGTVFFPFVLLGAGALFLVFYYTQWPLTKMFHGSKIQLRKNQAVDKKKKNK